MSKVSFLPHSVTVDHFGAAFSYVLRDLMKQDGDKRKRKTARNTLVTMAKRSATIHQDSEVFHVGYTVDKAGQIWITFIEEQEEAQSAPTEGTPDATHIDAYKLLSEEHARVLGELNKVRVELAAQAISNLNRVNDLRKRTQEVDLSTYGDDVRESMQILLAHFLDEIDRVFKGMEIPSALEEQRKENGPRFAINQQVGTNISMLDYPNARILSSYWDEEQKAYYYNIKLQDGEQVTHVPEGSLEAL